MTTLDTTRPFIRTKDRTVWVRRLPADAALVQVYLLLLAEARRKAAMEVEA